MLFKNIKTHKPFAYVAFKFISVNSKKITDDFFITGYLFKIYNIDLVYHHFRNKIIYYLPYIFSHKLNSTIDNYISNNPFYQCDIFLVWLY